MLAARFVIFLLFLYKGAIASKWQYKGATGPQEWGSTFPACGLKSQSPINIVASSVVPDERLGLLKLQGYNQSLAGGQFINNGHTVQLNFPKGKVFKLSGAGVNGTYTALQLHFHWRAANSSIDGGSEHAVNGLFYDAEMHIVHIKDPYTSLEQIKDMSDGLAVIGVFLLVDSDAQPHKGYQTLLDTAALAKQKGDTADLSDKVTLLSLLPASGSYFRYSGSLTTPPCYEAVQWTVYQNHVTISPDQLKMLQSLKVNPPTPSTPPEGESHLEESSHGDEHEELSDNFRPTQPLHGRVVTGFYDISVHVTKEPPWHYDGGYGPDHWSDSHSTCKGRRQSPIDFDSKAAAAASDLNGLEFSSTYSEVTDGVLVNNGHTIMYKLPDGIYFKNNKVEFDAVQLHFHWARASAGASGVTSSGGSEHTVNGHHYPIELHIVHSKKEGEERERSDDDLAVLGVFFQVAEEENLITQDAEEALEQLTDLFEFIQYEDMDYPVVKGPDLMKLLPANQSYYRYYGSLTTPPCTEAVMWTVFTHPVNISKERFLAFQSIFNVNVDEIKQGNGTDDPSNPVNKDAAEALNSVLLSGNFRPAQPLDGRTVQLYVDTGSGAAASSTGLIVLLVLLALVLLAAVIGIAVLCQRKSHKAGYVEGQPSKA